LTTVAAVTEETFTCAAVSTVSPSASLGSIGSRDAETVEYVSSVYSVEPYPAVAASSASATLPEKPPFTVTARTTGTAVSADLKPGVVVERPSVAAVSSASSESLESSTVAAVTAMSSVVQKGGVQVEKTPVVRVILSRVTTAASSAITEQPSVSTIAAVTEQAGVTAVTAVTEQPPTVRSVGSIEKGPVTNVDGVDGQRTVSAVLPVSDHHAHAEQLADGVERCVNEHSERAGDPRLPNGVERHVEESRVQRCYVELTIAAEKSQRVK
jgi:hypothetical protein